MEKLNWIMDVDSKIRVDYENKILYLLETSPREAYQRMRAFKMEYPDFLQFSIDGLLGEFVDIDGNREGNGNFMFDGNLTKGWRYSTLIEEKEWK